MRALVLLFFFAAANPASAYVSTWGDKRVDFTKKKPATPKEPAGPPDDRPGPLLHNDILLGFKLGFQHTTFTDVRRLDADFPLTPGRSYLIGGALYWNLGKPRLELDLLLHGRKQGDRSPVPNIGMPVLAKFALLQKGRWCWQAGGGLQADFAIGGSGSKRNVLFGVPLSTDFLYELSRRTGALAVLEARFNLGLTSFDAAAAGGRPRDFTLIAGLLFPIDREGL
jgi:hypothetical protein